MIIISELQILSLVRHVMFSIAGIIRNGDKYVTLVRGTTLVRDQSDKMSTLHL